MHEKGQAGGNARTVQEFVTYLQVEKGLRPASCEAYRRDLEQFAEHVVGRHELEGVDEPLGVGLEVNVGEEAGVADALGGGLDLRRGGFGAGFQAREGE